MTGSEDWAKWPDRYDDSLPLQVRLAAVRAQVSAFLDECPPGPVRILSLCSGDGRDVLPVVSAHARLRDVEVWCIDANAKTLDRGKESARQAGLQRKTHFVQADAGLAASYADVVPADLVILSGMLGHLTSHDALNLFHRLPALCRTNGSVLWSRLNRGIGNRQIPALREVLRESGFEEVFLEETMPNEFVVARAHFRGTEAKLAFGEVLFRFVGLRHIHNRSTSLGDLKFQLDYWIGHFEHPGFDTPIELCINGSDSGPDDEEIRLVHEFLHEGFPSRRRLLPNIFTVWAYHPTRIEVNSDRQIVIHLESKLPFLSTRTVLASRSRS